MPTIREVLAGKSGDVVTIGPDRTVFEAIGRLVEHGIGSLVVRDEEGGIAGILTERDILRTVRQHPDRLHTAPVSEIMTREIVCGVPDDDLDYAMTTMTTRRFRHLPITEGGKLVGIVSIGDLVKAMNSARAYEIRMLRDYISGTYGSPSG